MAGVGRDHRRAEFHCPNRLPDYGQYRQSVEAAAWVFGQPIGTEAVSFGYLSVLDDGSHRRLGHEGRSVDPDAHAGPYRAIAMWLSVRPRCRSNRPSEDVA